MFFYLSKIIWFILQPSSLLLLGVCIGIWLVRWGRIEAGLRWLTGSMIALGIVGVTALSDIITSPLQNRFPRPDLAALQIDGIIVLGGAEDTRPGLRELMSLNEAGERVTEAVALARRFPTAKLVWSGGSGNLLTERISAAERALALFEAFGIARDRIVLEDASRTTDENARLTRDSVKPKPGQRWLLVTSAWHMPRAVGCFRQAGFEVVAWPVDYRTPEDVNWLQVFGSVPDGLRRFDTMTREYVGLLAYRVTGRTDALFPAPTVPTIGPSTVSTGKQ
jgi:uncharacterized SAM-binding protein YcdF (DUF218 family)